MLELSTLFLEGSRYRRKSSMADPTFEAAESYERASPNHTASLGPPPILQPTPELWTSCPGTSPPPRSPLSLSRLPVWVSRVDEQRALEQPTSRHGASFSLACIMEPARAQDRSRQTCCSTSNHGESWSETLADPHAADHRTAVPCPLLHGTWLLPLHQEDEQHNDAPLCTDNYSLPTNGPRCNFLTRLPVRGPPRQPEPDDETTSPPGTSYLPLSLCLRRIALCQQPTTSRPSGSFVACHNLARIDEQSGPV
ncbi:hypothetical protein IWX91DRAFT_132116 [Phyllosticta citricarpa]